MASLTKHTAVGAFVILNLMSTQPHTYTYALETTEDDPQTGFNSENGKMNWFLFWLISFIVIGVFDLYIEYRQLKQFYTHEIPPKLKEVVNYKEFEKCRSYSLALKKHLMFSKTVNLIEHIVIWCTGLPVILWNHTKQWSPNPSEDGLAYDFRQAIFLTFILELIEFVIEAPSDLYVTFRIKQRYGYNNQTCKGWIKDKILANIIKVLLVSGFLYGLLWIIHTTGDNFVFYTCLFITGAILLLIFLFPLVIMPIFNRFDPLEDNALKKDIEELATSVKFPLHKIEMVDGSKRSNHSNAFFYGFGKIKKIVLFDSLLEQYLGVKQEVADALKTEENN